MHKVQDVQLDGHRSSSFAADPLTERVLEAANLLIEIPDIRGYAAVAGEMQEQGDRVLLLDVCLSHAAHLKIINGFTFMQLFLRFAVRREGEIVLSSDTARVIGGSIHAVHEVPYKYPQVFLQKIVDRKVSDR